MKPIAFFPQSLFRIFSAFTENKNASVMKSVRDDDKTLTIRIRYMSDSKNLNYENSFNVEGWSKAQKNELVRRVSGSLGIMTPKVAKL